VSGGGRREGHIGKVKERVKSGIEIRGVHPEGGDQEGKRVDGKYPVPSLDNEVVVLTLAKVQNSGLGTFTKGSLYTFGGCVGGCLAW
jgi:hypothetical protein